MQKHIRLGCIDRSFHAASAALVPRAPPLSHD